MITLGQLSTALDALKQAGVWNPHEPYRPDTSLSTLLAMILRDLENVPRMKERK